MKISHTELKLPAHLTSELRFQGEIEAYFLTISEWPEPDRSFLGVNYFDGREIIEVDAASIADAQAKLDALKFSDLLTDFSL